jgi:DNA polymerase-3 subunit epsilon
VTWHLGRLAPYDLETTSPDPEEARIVEAYVGQVGGGRDPIDYTPLLVNPGVEIPAEAVKIHGHTTEHVREHGMAPEQAIPRIATAVAAAWKGGIPLVGHNIRYDLTVIDRELVRYGEAPLIEWAGGSYGPVIDTQVLSKHVDRWRKRVSEDQGAHTLKTCAQVFGIAWVDEDAHGARYDALISARVAWRMGAIAAMPREQRPWIQASKRDERHLFDDIAVPLPELFARQQRWAAEQAASYQEYLRSPKAREKRNPDAVIDGSWPVQTTRSKETQPDAREAIAS